VDTYDWLLFLHVLGAFLVLGGAVLAGVFNFAALRRERPSEIALLFKFARVGVASIGIGMVLTIVLGLLWVLANALGGIGGSRERKTRQLAERLAAEGDTPSAELTARLHDPVWLALSWGGGVVILVILALMIWKPGT